MSRIPLLLLVALCLIGAVAAFFWFAVEEPVAPVATADDRVVERDVAVVAAGPAPANVDAVIDDLAERMREDASVGDPDDDAARTFTVQVWDREPGRPGAEAEVFVLKDFDGWRRRDPFAPTPCEVAIARGRRYVADRQGRLQLRSLGRWTVVAARLPGASGYETVGRRRGDVVTVVARAEETVTVRVVDAAGAPVADAPVGVLQRVPEKMDWDRMMRGWKELEARIATTQGELDANARDAGARQRLQMLQGRREQLAAQLGAAKQRAVERGDFEKGRAPQGVIEVEFQMRARRRTDERGLAMFRHFQLDRHDEQEWWPDEHRSRFEAALLVPAAAPERREFGGRPVPEDVIELRMPATGSIALRTVDRDGRPFTHPVHGELRVAAAGAPDWTRVPIRKPQGEVEIVYPTVGLGMTFEAHCRLDDDDFRWTTAAFDGPTMPGERVTVDLVVAPDAGMLRGRVLAAGGAALAGEKVTFLVNSIRGRLEGEDVVLDDRGRFHLPYYLRGEHAAPFRLQLRMGAPEGGREPGLAMTLPLLPPDRVLDLGDLRLDGFARIAHGVVVDDRGEPVAGARVQLQRERDEGGAEPRLVFRDEAFTDARTDERGAFELFGDLEAARYRLHATADGMFPATSDGLLREAPIELRMERKARLVGTARKPEWMSPQSVQLKLLPWNGGRAREDQLHAWKGEDYIYFDWVRAGTYDLEFYVRNTPEPFLVVRGLEVRAGQHDAHPRLQGVDLAGLLHRYEVFAFDDRGAPLTPKEPLVARVTRPSGEVASVGYSWKNGRVEFTAASPMVEVVPFARGHHLPPRTLAPGRSELHFLALPPLELHTPGLAALADGTPGWLSVEPLDPLELFGTQRTGRGLVPQFVGQQSSYARIASDDVAQLQLLRDGRYRVVAHFGDKRTGVVSTPLGEVDVRLVPGAPAQRLTLAVPSASVQQAAQQAARRMADRTEDGK